MRHFFLQSSAEAAGESVGQIAFYIILIGLGLFLYFKVRNRNKKK